MRTVLVADDTRAMMDASLQPAARRVHPGRIFPMSGVPVAELSPRPMRTAGVVSFQESRGVMLRNARGRPPAVGLRATRDT